MRDKDDDWATPSLRDAAARRRATRPYLSDHERLQGPPFESLLSEREKRAGKGCLAGFVAAWLVSLLFSVAILGLVVWGLISLISYLDRH